MAYDEDAAEHLLLGAAVLGGDQLADPVGEMRGREMKGWLRVDAARALPPKEKK